MRFSLIIRATAAVAALALCLPVLRSPSQPLFAGAGAAAPVSAIDPANFDPTCPACRDFYQFATGGWQKNHPIPAAYSAYSPWTEVSNRNLDTLRTLLDGAAATAATPANANEGRLGAYYKTCIDEAAIDKAGAAPLGPELARINAITDNAAFLSEVARLNQRGSTMLFAFGQTANPHDSANVIAEIGQSGLSLPERDYYLRTDAAGQKIRDNYVAFVANMLKLAGSDSEAAGRDAVTVLAVETKLAKASLTNVELRDPVKTTNVMTLVEAAKLAPSLDLVGFVAAVGAPTSGKVNVDTVDFMKALDGILTATPIADWRAYARWHYVRSVANLLATPFGDEAFRFTATLTGQKEQQPRWKRCVASTSDALGDAVGAYFVQKTFSPQAKARVLSLVDNLRATLRDDIATLPWMSAPTRKEALVKLARMREKIGYPDKFKDYSALSFGTDSYLENALRARAFGWAREVTKIGKPIDRNEWFFTPQTINAAYDSQNNDITFPAGILQPPFFALGNDDALNYGAIGAVIGHEMTHGFDDQGRQFDAVGNLRDWWTKADAERFASRSSCIVNQYSALPVGDGITQNGQLVQGEAIADLGGLVIAYKAFQKTMNGKSHAAVGGYTPEQRFFLAYANIWAANIRPERAKLLAKTDPHSKPRNRVIGTLSNMPEFTAAFKCKASDGMVLAASKRCSIW